MRLSLLLIGLYSLYGCTSEEPAAIECNQVNFALSVTTTDSPCNLSQGSITVFSAINEGLRYRLNDGSWQEQPVFAGLPPGTYTVRVQNQDGCEAELPALIRSGISFSTSIQPIINQSCALSGCHDGSGNIDFRVFDNLLINPQDIKARTQSGNMPKEGSLTPEEIAMIACWVDDGTPNN